MLHAVFVVVVAFYFVAVMGTVTRRVWVAQPVSTTNTSQRKYVFFFNVVNFYICTCVLNKPVSGGGAAAAPGL